MNKFFFILISCILFYSLKAYSQFIPEISMGWGEYKMDELKDIQGEIRHSYPVGLKSVNSFPPYYFYKASLLYGIKSFQFGISWNHYSTGARDHYEDYSGEISVKQLVISSVLSFPFLIRINPEKRFNLFFMLEPGINFTKHEIKEEVRILSESWNNNYFYDFNTLSILPALKLSYTYKRWQPSMNIGYFFDSKIKVEMEDTKIIISKDELKFTDFSGLRLWFSLAYKIN